MNQNSIENLPTAARWAAVLAENYNGTATEDDIFYCFRLLLGRQPEPGEWAGHSMQAGTELDLVVKSYLNSLEFSRRKLLAQSEPDSLKIAQFERFRIYADLDDPLVGANVAAGVYEPEIVAQFEQVLRPGMGVVDIGANIGFFTMVAASLVGPAGYVLAVEPNPANVRLLEASRQLNGFDQVTVLQCAAGATTGLLALNAMHSTGVTSSVAGGEAAVLASRLVPCLPIDRMLPEGRKIGLIKIDVDGSEYHALRGVQQCIARDRPVIITEFTPAALPGLSGIAGQAYLQWLQALGYSFSIIEKDGSTSAAVHSNQVMQVLGQRGSDHLDLICHPVAEFPLLARLRRNRRSSLKAC